MNLSSNVYLEVLQCYYDKSMQIEAEKQFKKNLIKKKMKTRQICSIK